MDELEFLRSFRRHSNGSWSAIKKVTIEGGISLEPGHVFTRHVTFNGIDIAERLETLAAKYPQDVQT
jgi:hypothetical protein